MTLFLRSYEVTLLYLQQKLLKWHGQLMKTLLRLGHIDETVRSQRRFSVREGLLDASACWLSHMKTINH